MNVPRFFIQRITALLTDGSRVTNVICGRVPAPRGIEAAIDYGGYLTIYIVVGASGELRFIFQGGDSGTQQAAQQDLDRALLAVTKEMLVVKYEGVTS